MGCISNGQCRDGRLLAQHNGDMHIMQEPIINSFRGLKVLCSMLQGNDYQQISKQVSSEWKRLEGEIV